MNFEDGLGLPYIEILDLGYNQQGRYFHNLHCRHKYVINLTNVQFHELPFYLIQNLSLKELKFQML